jgi:hypothetical protein
VVSAADDKLLAAALEHAADSIRDVWEDNTIPSRLELWRLNSDQRRWIAAQAIFAWQAKRREQAIMAHGDTEEWLRTFTEPRQELTPDQEAVASAVLPMVRSFVTERGLHLRPIGEWSRIDVCLMILGIIHAGSKSVEALNRETEDTPPWDELPISSGKLLAAG